jgi:hypothetical protein
VNALLQYLMSRKTTIDLRYIRENEFSFHGNYQITDRFVIGRRDVDWREFPCSVQPGELHGIASVGLDTFSGPSWDEARRYHGTLDSHSFELPMELKSARPCFVAAVKVVYLGQQLAERPADHLGLVRNLPDKWNVTARAQLRDRNRVLVDVETYVRHLLHGRLLCLRLWPRGRHGLRG